MQMATHLQTQSRMYILTPRISDRRKGFTKNSADTKHVVSLHRSNPAIKEIHTHTHFSGIMNIRPATRPHRPQAAGDTAVDRDHLNVVAFRAHDLLIYDIWRAVALQLGTQQTTPIAGNTATDSLLATQPHIHYNPHNTRWLP